MYFISALCVPFLRNVPVSSFRGSGAPPAPLLGVLCVLSMALEARGVALKARWQQVGLESGDDRDPELPSSREHSPVLGEQAKSPPVLAEQAQLFYRSRTVG